MVDGLEHCLFSPIVGMIQSDFHIFQRGWNHQPAKWLNHESQIVVTSPWQLLVFADFANLMAAMVQSIFDNEMRCVAQEP